MSDPLKSQLDALMGAALQRLASSGLIAGAPAAALGEFMDSYRQDVSAILGLTVKPPEAPELLGLVKDAVKLALAELPALGEASAPRKPRKLKEHTARRINVEVNGIRTSLSLNSALVERVVQVQGGEASMRAFIQELAQSIPPSVPNRSGWMSERLEAALSFAHEERDTAHARH